MVSCDVLAIPGTSLQMAWFKWENQGNDMREKNWEHSGQEGIRKPFLSSEFG